MSRAPQPTEVARRSSPTRRGSFSTHVLEDCLDDLARAIPASLEASPHDLHEQVVLLMLLLASAELTREGGIGDIDSFPHLLSRARSADGDWLEAPGEIRDLPLLQRCDPSAATAVGLRDAVVGATRPAQRAPETIADSLGRLHECLLVLRFERIASDAVRLRTRRGWFEPGRALSWSAPVRAKRLQLELGLSKRSVEQFGPKLEAAASTGDVEVALSALLCKTGQRRPAGSWVVQPSVVRRRRGAHYTPPELCRSVVARTLAPLLAALPEPRSQSLVRLRVCDPAMGAGAFLIEAGEAIARELAGAWRREGQASQTETDLLPRARREVCAKVLRGVDENPTATSLARLSIATYARVPGRALHEHLRCGNSLVGDDGRASAPSPDARSLEPELEGRRLDWPEAFPEVFSTNARGFDALIGNPPWVAFVGRARQPIAPALARYFSATNPAFRRYRTLHGLFVYRCARLLRPGGRLGLVLPTSVADLDGYRDTRAAHDALCDVDEDLPNFRDGAFAGVFQPSMALLSTRRDDSPAAACSAPSRLWPLSRDDIGALERTLLERLAALPRLPPDLFGERGFQTTRDDQAHLRRLLSPVAPFRVPLLEGADVSEFVARPPRLFADPGALSGRLRSRDQWQRVALLIRQTARYPIAAPADGTAFRNSILACFETERWPRPLLLGLLNSSLCRWLHYWRHRDAREGMPQLKVGHLRALPALPSEAPAARQALSALGSDLLERPRPLTEHERQSLDAIVASAFHLTGDEQQAVRTWATANPPPAPRKKGPE